MEWWVCLSWNRALAKGVLCFCREWLPPKHLYTLSMHSPRSQLGPNDEFIPVLHVVTLLLNPGFSRDTRFPRSKQMPMPMCLLPSCTLYNADAASVLTVGTVDILRGIPSCPSSDPLSPGDSIAKLPWMRRFASFFSASVMLSSLLRMSGVHCDSLGECPIDMPTRICPSRQHMRRLRL